MRPLEPEVGGNVGEAGEAGGRSPPPVPARGPQALDLDGEPVFATPRTCCSAGEAELAGAAVVTGLAMGVQTVFFATAVQASVRPDVLARVAAIDLVGSEGGQPVGYALAGPLAAAVGAHAFLTASAAIMAAAGAAFTFVPALRADASAGPQGAA